MSGHASGVFAAFAVITGSTRYEANFAPFTSLPSGPVTLESSALTPEKLCPGRASSTVWKLPYSLPESRNPARSEPLPP